MHLGVHDFQAQRRLLCSGAERAVGDQQNRRVGPHRQVNNGLRFLCVGGIGDGDQQILRTHMAGVFSGHTADAVEQQGFFVGVIQRVGQIGGDRERAPLAGDVHRCGGLQTVQGLFEQAVIAGLRQFFQ